MSKYSIGLDFGTLSGRAVLVNLETGQEAATSVLEYPHAVMDSLFPAGKSLMWTGPCSTRRTILM